MYIDELIGGHQYESWCNRLISDQIFCHCQILRRIKYLQASKTL